ncbi:MAG: conjugal transfer protein TraF [Thiohalomonadales bacterium]
MQLRDARKQKMCKSYPGNLYHVLSYSDSMVSSHLSSCFDDLRVLLASFSLVAFVFMVTILSISLLGMRTAQAFPFPLQDARAASMGGVGVATGVRNAPFSNPALMATNDKDYDWIIMLPSVAETESIADDFDKNLEKFQKDYVPPPPGLSIPDAQARLDMLQQDTFTQSNITAITVVVPSETVAALAFVKDINYESAQVKVGTVGDPDGTTAQDPYDSQVEHRAISIQEVGVSLATLLHDPYLLPDDTLLGVNLRLSLIQAYGYSESVMVGSANLDTNQVQARTGAVNFDFGLAKEFGVWKVGIVVKDIIRFEREYGDSGDYYLVKPLIRFGFAYRSRKTLWEIDADLTENAALPHQAKTQYAALGFEYQLFSGFHVRLGLRQNSIGDKLLTKTAGLGLNYFGIEVNVSVVEDEIEKGGFAQLNLEF